VRQPGNPPKQIAPRWKTCSSAWTWDKHLTPTLKKVAAGNWDASPFGAFPGIKDGGTDIACCSDAVPKEAVAKVMAERDAIIAGKHMFGEFGGHIVGAVICLGLISSISAMTWIGPRVTMTMGEDIPMLRLFSLKSKHDVPAVAIVFQLLVSNLLLLTRSFEAVLDFIQFSLAFCSFFAVLGVISNGELAADLRDAFAAENLMRQAKYAQGNQQLQNAQQQSAPKF